MYFPPAAGATGGVGPIASAPFLLASSGFMTDNNMLIRLRGKLRQTTLILVIILINLFVFSVQRCTFRLQPGPRGAWARSPWRHSWCSEYASAFSPFIGNTSLDLVPLIVIKHSNTSLLSTKIFHCPAKFWRVHLVGFEGGGAWARPQARRS